MRMARVLVQQLVPAEMAILGLFECVFVFVLCAGMPGADGVAPILGGAGLAGDAGLLAATLTATIAGISATIGLYRPEVCRSRRRILLSSAIATVLAFPAILLVGGVYDITLTEAHVAYVVRLLAIWLPVVLLPRFAFSVAVPRMRVTRRVLILGDGERAARLRQRLLTRPHTRFEPISSGAQDLATTIARAPAIWGVVVAEDEPGTDPRKSLFDKKLRGLPVYNDLSFQERHLGRIEPGTIDASWLLFSDGFRNNRLSRAISRLLDIAVGLLLAIITLPLMLFTAILIKLDSPGPVFYRQERVGLHGATFTLFKFRSMVTDAEAAGRPQWARTRDPRVTRVGRFIRACRIDELPQLFNVLRGEMSMIGPRPERPAFVDELGKVIPFYHHRGYAKPGLTGWAQVNYPYGASVEDAREKLAYDLWYVKNRGVLLDLVILLSTVRVVLFREGAR